ncbi:hypothetical protein BvCmsNSP045_00811 [Escherichia coli]|nr:hypothetical protein BvCmsNSP045_00811 [Escherichia coli]
MTKFISVKVSVELFQKVRNTVNSVECLAHVSV